MMARGTGRHSRASTMIYLSIMLLFYDRICHLKSYRRENQAKNDPKRVKNECKTRLFVPSDVYLAYHVISMPSKRSNETICVKCVVIHMTYK